jgi:short-subunit dehydrogenase
MITGITKTVNSFTNSYPFLTGWIELMVCLAFLPPLLFMSFLFKLYDVCAGRRKVNLVPELHSKFSIVITGASAGIGKALVFEYAKRYSHSHELCFGLIGTNETRLKQVVNELREKYGIPQENMQYAVMDVRNKDAMKDFIEKMERKFDGINVLVANAGVADYSLKKNNPNLEIGEIQHKVLDINMKGLMNTVLPIVNRLNREKKVDTGYWGKQSICICMISSISAEFPHSSFYSVVKKAVLEYGRFLRWTFAKNPHVSVTVVLPGFVDTHLGQAFPAEKFLMLDPYTTAELMREGLERGDEIVAFPFTFYLVVKLTQVLPLGLFEPINKVLKLEP